MVAVIGKKVGMSRVYGENGAVIPVTLVEVYDGLVSSVKKYDDKQFNHITLSFGRDKKTEKRIGKAAMGFYKKNGLEARDNMQTFKISKDKKYSIGDILGLGELEVGDVVDVIGTSKGKGFAGAMKRHGFSGKGASHGVSLTHRHPGSTGNRRREGKVRKGKKMAGHLGNERVTVKNLEVVKLIPEDKIVCVKGAVPGSKGGKLIINKSK
ncbi:MAG: 50S ribosomal protein L3 [Rickettsiales bacterium]|jgi:large subunit ribosomal protein L3|nr:50S ribosomal protein L3 [Rickettsiales bacterium]